MKHYFTRIEDAMKKYWKSPALTNYGGKTYTFEDIARYVEKFHIVFETIGLKKGDHVALCGHNCAEWGLAFLGADTYEAVCVPILNDFPPESIQTLTTHSDSVLLFTDEAVWKKIDREKMPSLEVAISLEDFKILWAKDETVLDARVKVDGEYAVRHPEGLKPEDVSYPVRNMDDLCLINYTSGTTSAPKGVMLTYRNISSNIEFGEKGIPHLPGDTIVSMLPLAHMFGLAFEFLYQIAAGAHVYFLGRLPSPKLLMQSFQEVKPFMLITVPLVIEKIFKKSVFPTVKKPSVRKMMKVPFINNIIKKQVKRGIMTAFGGQMRDLIIGGAALNPEVEWWMKAVKLP